MYGSSESVNVQVSKYWYHIRNFQGAELRHAYMNKKSCQPIYHFYFIGFLQNSVNSPNITCLQYAITRDI